MVRRLLVSILICLSGFTLTAQSFFFEAPEGFTEADRRFPQLSEFDGGAVLAYQRISGTDGSRTLDVLIQTIRDGQSWSEPMLVASDLRFEGTSVPPIFHLAASRSGEVMVATLTYQTGGTQDGTSIVRLSRAPRPGAAFETVHTIVGDIRLVSPKVFAAASGGWFLALERLDEVANRIVYVHSPDGSEWGELLAIPADAGQTGTQSDVSHMAVGSRDLFFFVGENIVPPSPPRDADGVPTEPQVPDTPQIYAIHTNDSGVSWSATDPATREDHPARPGSLLETSILDLEGQVIPHFYLRVVSTGARALGVAAQADFVMRSPAPAIEIGSNAGAGLAFEIGLRRETAAVRQLAYARIDANGNLASDIEVLTANTVRRADARVAHSQPLLVQIDGRSYVVGVVDPARGGDVLIFERSGSAWRRIVNAQRQFAGFPTGAVVGNRLHFFWHSRPDNAANRPTRIVYLEPDQSARPPIVRGVNFAADARSAGSTAELAWAAALDASGIVGYSYIWTRDPHAPVPTDNPVVSTSATFSAPEDGEWFLRIRALDRAGNWSPAGTTRFFRDTTPPDRVSFIRPPLDEEGFLASNTFTISWNPPRIDVEGGPEVVTEYISELVYVAAADSDIDVIGLSPIEPRIGTRTSAPAIDRDNNDNGLWGVTVRAVDSVGNVGPAATLFVRMNKYVPVTIITTIAAIPDLLGRYTLDIVGRGFTADGRINRIVLDRDGRAPYDHVFDETSPGFRVFSDRSMAGPLLDNIDSGEYLIGLFHPERGMRFTQTRLSIDRNGTVKFGDFTVIPGRSFAAELPQMFRLTAPGFIAWLVIAMMALVALMSGARVVALTREAVQFRLETRALIAGRPGLIAQKEERIAKMKQKGVGLRTKFAFFVVLLVFSVVVMISVGLGGATLNSQRQVLVRGLKERVDVLMQSMVAGAAQPLLDPDLNTLALDQLPASTRAMDEALYATVTGPASGFAPAGFESSFNYVWGSNDPIIRAAGVIEVDTREALLSGRTAQGLDRTPVPADSVLFLGRTRVEDPVARQIEVVGQVVDLLARSRLNLLLRERELAFATVDELRQQISALEFTGGDASALERDRQRARLTQDSLNQQLRSGIDQVSRDASVLTGYTLALTGSEYEVPNTAEEIERDLMAARTALEADPGLLSRLSDPVQSLPVFDAAGFDGSISDYLFYQSIVEPDISLFPIDSEAIELLDLDSLSSISYFRGAVRLGVATDLILEQIDQSRTDIIQITALIALGAVGAGILGALLLATIVVIPINKLVRGVEHIRDTVDKSGLKEYQISLRSKDELFRLADTINTMTFALAVAAEAERALRVTSDLQKKFIPLEEVTYDGTKKRKLTMAHLEADGLEFHGYYEGADALSGDYFTYEALGKSRYAFIKCDVSGHGVNAAFIMVEVATIFLNRVREWRTTSKKPDLVDLLTTVNDLLIDRGFEGMFAAMVVGVIDAQSGRIRMAHAGDVEQRFYRSDRAEVELIMLPGAPATGVFEFDMFQELGQALAPGDIMLLATDGIEESARFMRDADYRLLDFGEEEAAKIAAEAAALDPPSAVDYDQKEHFVKEEFSTPRWERIVQEVQHAGSFTLERVRSRTPDERLVFSYRGLESTAENTVLAIMAAEKVFRLTPDPKSRSDEPVRVDRRIDEFLHDHFSEYRRYFAHPLSEDRRPDAKDIRQEYVYYTHLFEEDQSDDLTILTIRRK